MNHNQYFSQCQPRRKTRKAPIVIVLVIASLLALYGWMDNRDREHQEEVDYLATVVHSQAMEILRMTQSECAPAFEMDMPIDMGRVQL